MVLDEPGLVNAEHMVVVGQGAGCIDEAQLNAKGTIRKGEPNERTV